MPETDKIEVSPNAVYDKGRKSRSRVIATDISKHKHSTVSAETKKKAEVYAEQYMESLPAQADRQLNFALKLYKLSAIWVDILVYLHNHNGVYCGNYTDLTVALGRNPGPRGHSANIRKCCVELAQRDLIFIECGETGYPKLIRLNEDWMYMI